MNFNLKSAPAVAAAGVDKTRTLWGEMLQFRGLVPLLTKRRGSHRWSPEDKAEFRVHLARLSHMSPYLVVLALPGSFLMLPILVWWTNRRSRQGSSA
jgi:hypothetical protein